MKYDPIIHLQLFPPSLSRALSLSPLHPLPPHPPATVDHLRPPTTTSGQCNHHASEPPPFRVSLSRGLSLVRSLSLHYTHCHHTLRPPSTTSGHLRPLLGFSPAIVVPPFLQGKFLTRFEAPGKQQMYLFLII